MADFAFYTTAVSVCRSFYVSHSSSAAAAVAADDDNAGDGERERTRARTHIHTPAIYATRIRISQCTVKYL